MGKRRLTLLGLRPRHTAVVFTVVTGMLIASLTLGVLVWASRGVRIAVTRGEQLLYDNHRLKQQRRTLERVRRDLTAQTAKLKTANAALVWHNQDLRQEEERLRQETGRLQKHGDALQTKNEKLRARNVALDQRSARLTRNNRALTRRNQSLAAASERLLQSSRRLAHTNRQLTAANSDLKGLNQGLAVAAQGLRQARDKAQAQLTKVHVNLIQTQANLSQAQADLVHVQRNAIRLLNSASRQSERGEELATGIVVVHMGEELARRVIPARAPAGTVRSILADLLSAAQSEVDRRVNRAHGHSRHVRLNPRGGAPDDLMEQTVMALMTESHPINGRMPTVQMPEIHPLVIRAVASQNEAAESSDPVEVDIVGQVNELAFRRGEEIAYVGLPAASTSGELLKDLVGFLQGPVRAAAIRRSIVPDESGSVGEIDYDPLLEVVRKVRRMPGWVKVGAVAAADTWSAGPLRLDFYVVPVDTRVAAEQKRP